VTSLPGASRSPLGAKQCLHNTLREAVARHDSGIGVEHIALGLLATNRGLVPPILEEAGVSAAALRAAIVDRYRSAS
jgi:ATP-dependent Clp protease ATP-binding subunit ClpA